RLTLLRIQLALTTASIVPPALVDVLKQAQQAFARSGSSLDECLAWLLLGRSALRQHQLAEARTCYETVLERSRKSGDSTLEFRALHGLAMVEQREGRLEEAILLLQLAIDKLELIRQKLQIETFRVAFLSDHVELYHDLIGLYQSQNHWELTFQTVERTKSRLVSEKLAIRLHNEVVDAATSPDVHVRQLANRLQTVLTQLDQVYRDVRIRQVGDPDQSSATDEEM